MPTGGILNSTPPLSPSSSIGPGRIIPRKIHCQWEGGFGETSPDRECKISEMVNPDGSVTVRKRVLNPDGSRSILQEEYSSMDRRIIEKFRGTNFSGSYGDPLPPMDRSSSESDSSIATMKTTPSRNAQYLSSDQSSETSAFSPPRKANAVANSGYGRLEPPVARSSNAPIRFKPSGLEPEDGRSESSEASIPYQDEGVREGANLMEFRRPKNPVPFELKEDVLAIPAMSVNTWGLDDPDVSAMSGDSMGYPLLDTSTVLYQEHDTRSDEESEWSLLQDESDTGVSTEKERGKPSLALRASKDRNEVTKSRIVNVKIGNNDAGNDLLSSSRCSSSRKDAENGGFLLNVGLAGSEKSSLGSPARDNIVVLQQTPNLARPRPQVRYFADPGSTVASSVDDEQRELRFKGALFDTRSLNTHDQGETSRNQPSDEIVLTVRKKSPDDKIGIFVGVRELTSGPRLVVTKVSPNGKFVESPVEMGDVIVSINGINFLRYPNSEEALDIVRRATDRITFVVKKSRDPTTDMSIEDLSLPSLPYQRVEETVHADQSMTVTREISNTDGSQTVVNEFFDPSGRKQKQTTTRQWIMFDGSTRDISIVSRDVNGNLSMLVKKPSQSHTVGLGLQVKRTHRGRNSLVVSQVFPSGLFARTPLSVDDVILSINNVDFKGNPDATKASVILAQAERDITIRASKSLDWIESKQKGISQTRQLVETFTIPAPKSKSLEYDDSSYGGSLLGYMPAKKLTLKKFSASEQLGLAIQSQLTQWGTLLVTTAIAPSSRLALVGLKEGDVVLSVNGVDFTEDPDASRAMNLIRNNGDGDIEIEYQRVQDNQDGPKVETPQVETIETFKPDGTKCMRTERRNPDGSIFVKIEEIGPDNPLDVTIDEPQGSFIGNFDRSEATGWDDASLQHSFREPSINSRRATSPGSNLLAPQNVLVEKAHPTQDVGINLATLRGVLYVRAISTKGLLVGKPILPGDTILSINGVDFRKEPNVREAMSVMSKSTSKITFRILKTSMVGGVGNRRRSQRTRVHRLCCGKSSRLVDHSDNIRRTSPIGQQTTPTDGRVPFYL